MDERRLRELAGLDRHVGADHGIGISVGADDVVDAGVESEHDARLGGAHHSGALAILVALIGIDVVDDAPLARHLAAGNLGYQAQPPGVEHEALLHGTLARDRDLAGEMGAAERDVDHVLAGLEPDLRARLAVRGDEPRLAVGPGPVAKNSPHQALVDALPVLGEQGHKRELAAAAKGRRTLLGFRCGARHDRGVGRQLDGRQRRPKARDLRR